MMLRASASLLPFVAILLWSCSPGRTGLDEIRERGELRVATRNGPTTYFTDRDGDTGIEFELAKLFAAELGVKLKVIVKENAKDALQAVSDGEADLAAAGVPRYVVEEAGLTPGESYHWVTDHVVYRYGRRAPAALDQIPPEELHLTRDAIPGKDLARLAQEHPGLVLRIHDDLETGQLLDMLVERRIAYTVLPSDELAFARQAQPEIRPALAITPPEPLVWALPAETDESLKKAVSAFVQRINSDGQLGKLLEHFYTPMEGFDYVDSRAFIRRMEERLPRYRPTFEDVGARHGIDWRLLAAISYQESHWDAEARSPTGVRGLMMLTLPTAKRLGVEDRLDPEESTDGAARYLNELAQTMPERIPDPDRMWMILAAYNVGFGHLEDARRLTQRQGKDPDSWQDVRGVLPLLSTERWYSQTRHGYARGHEPVNFVRSVRRYYSVLVQLTQPELQEAEQLIEVEFVKSRFL